MNYAGLNRRTGEDHLGRRCICRCPIAARPPRIFSARSLRHAEQMILENKQPYPIRRTLLTSA